MPARLDIFLMLIFPVFVCLHLFHHCRSSVSSMHLNTNTYTHRHPLSQLIQLFHHGRNSVSPPVNPCIHIHTHTSHLRNLFQPLQKLSHATRESMHTHTHTHTSHLRNLFQPLQKLSHANQECTYTRRLSCSKSQRMNNREVYTALSMLLHTETFLS